MLARSRLDRLAQRQRLQIVAPADLGFAIVFYRTEKLRHRADESVGEPHFLPARRQPVAGLAFCGEVERARGAGGIVGPADRAARQAFRAFDTPANVDVALAA